MNDSISAPKSPVKPDLAAIVQGWLDRFERSLEHGDVNGLEDLFEAHGQWRDVLAFTWHIEPRAGQIGRAHV